VVRCRRVPGITAGYVEIGPASGDQSARTVGQDQHQLDFATTAPPAQNLQRLSLERVLRPDNRYPIRIAVEVMVGSVSTLPSTA
jgi:hypothetical protein